MKISEQELKDLEHWESTIDPDHQHMEPCIIDTTNNILYISKQEYEANWEYSLMPNVRVIQD